MYDWKFRILSEIRRGNWAIHLSKEQAQQAVNDFLSVKTEVDTPLSARVPFPIVVATEGSLVSGTYSNFEEVPKGSIAFFSIGGTMLKYGTMCSYGTEEIAYYITQAANSSNIDGIFLKIDSPGGATNSIPPLVEAFNVARQNGKASVASIDSAYSAGYWLAACCDKIFANNAITAGVGSIGVYTVFVNDKEKMAKEGVRVDIVKSRKSPEKILDYEKAMLGDYEMLQNSMDPVAEAFQNFVKNNRPDLKLSADPKLLQGATYTAIEGVENGLLDGILTEIEALQYLHNLIKINQFVNSKKK